MDSCICKYKRELTAKILLEEFHKKTNGREIKMDEQYRKQVSIHEAGHAFVQQFFGQKPVLATIVSRGGYGGFVQASKKFRSNMITDEDMRNQICISLAGRASEQVMYYNDLNTRTIGSGGPDHSDLSKASRIALEMVTQYGMGSKLLQPVSSLSSKTYSQSFTSEGRQETESEEYSKANDIWYKECMDEADAILHEELEYTQRIIGENRSIVGNIAALLEKEGTITTDQIDKCFSGTEICRTQRLSSGKCDD